MVRRKLSVSTAGDGALPPGRAGNGVGVLPVTVMRPAVSTRRPVTSWSAPSPASRRASTTAPVVRSSPTTRRVSPEPGGVKMRSPKPSGNARRPAT
jgi:hypothetical protein